MKDLKFSSYINKELKKKILEHRDYEAVNRKQQFI